MSFIKQIVSVAAALCVMASGCKSTNKRSNLEGFSASSSAKNVAVLMTPYTPGDIFGQDLNNLHVLLQDPSANYNFTPYATYGATHQGMYDSIRNSAAQVSSDGTLLVFITAHGATNGTIQAAGQGYATFGYAHIVQAIKEGRAGRGKFKRLVVVISACYSGSWLSTLESTNGLIDERLVITSVDSGNLSYIGTATSAMYQAFQNNKNKPGVSMGQFLESAKTYQPLIQYSASSDSMLKEPFINAKANSDGTTEAPKKDEDRPNPSPPADQKPAESGIPASAYSTDLGAYVIGITEVNGANTNLYIYASKVLDSMSFKDANGNDYPCAQRMAAQDSWPFICQASVSSRYQQLSTVTGKGSAVGKTAELQIPIIKHN